MLEDVTPLIPAFNGKLLHSTTGNLKMDSEEAHDGVMEEIEHCQSKSFPRVLRVM